MMDEDNAYERWVEKLDLQRRALQLEMEELQAEINIEESSTQHSICLFTT